MNFILISLLEHILERKLTMENNENTTFERAYENAVFERVYNENAQRLTEVSQKSFWLKIVNGVSGSAYAQALLNLLKAGKDTPINLEGTLSPDRYKFGNNTISGARYFGNNRMLNTFLIEKIYEEMLLAHGRKYQKNIQSFMRSFMSRLDSGGIEFVEPHFVDYNTLVA